MQDDLPPLVPLTEAQERQRRADLEQRAADYRAKAARADERRLRNAETAKREHDALPEVKAARMKTNDAIRRKLHAKLRVTTDAAERMVIQGQIDAYKEPRPSGEPPNRNRRRRYRNQLGMMRKA